MTEEIATFSPLFIIYSISLLVAGVVFLRKEMKKGQLTGFELNAPRWQGGWLDLGIMLWCLLMIYAIVPRAAGPVGRLLKIDESNAIWGQVTAGFLTQLALCIFVLTVPLIYRNLVGQEINSRTSSKRLAVIEGVRSFFIAIPIIWVTSFGWNIVLKLGETMGLQLPTERQTLVTLFAESQSWQFTTTVIFFAVVVAPIAEEFMFRVVFYRFFKQKWGMPIAMVLSGLLFGIVHFNLVSLLPLIMIGILLARAYEKSGHVLTSIIFHGLFNLNTLIILLIQPKIPFLQ